MQARPPLIGIPRSPYKAATMMLDPKMHPAQAFAAIAGEAAAPAPAGGCHAQVKGMRMPQGVARSRMPLRTVVTFCSTWLALLMPS